MFLKNEDSPTEQVYEVEICWEAVRDKDSYEGSESLNLTSDESTLLGYLDDLKPTTTARGTSTRILVVSAEGTERKLHSLIVEEENMVGDITEGSAVEIKIRNGAAVVEEASFQHCHCGIIPLTSRCRCISTVRSPPPPTPPPTIYTGEAQITAIHPFSVTRAGKWAKDELCEKISFKLFIEIRGRRYQTMVYPDRPLHRFAAYIWWLICTEYDYDQIDVTATLLKPTVNVVATLLHDIEPIVGVYGLELWAIHDWIGQYDIYNWVS